MLYECTDCFNCADFAGGYRVFYLAEELEPDAVCEYYPVGFNDAEDCSCFDDLDFPVLFSQKELGKAEEYSEEKYGEVTYQGIREWVMEQIKVKKNDNG